MCCAVCRLTATVRARLPRNPTIPDIGILASTDILAIDQASIDLVYGRPAAEKHDLVERIESRRGLHQLTAMKALGMGNDQYDLITVP